MATITIVGAGAVGVAVATSVLHEGLAKALTIADLNADKAAGEALDFAHGVPAMPRRAVTVDAASMDALPGGDLCILTAGVKQRPGESRLQLLRRNAGAMLEIAGSLRRAPPYRCVLVVTNPLDPMTELFRRGAAPGTTVFGSGTVLDTLRLRALLGDRLRVGTSSVHAYVVGEHGDSAVALFDNARVGAMPLREFARRVGVPLESGDLARVQEDVRRAAYAVIERKGATSHAIGLAVGRIVRAITQDERVVLPVSTGYEGDISMSQPCIVGANGAEPIGMPPLSENETKLVAESVAVLRAACRELPQPAARK